MVAEGDLDVHESKLRCTLLHEEKRPIGEKKEDS